MWHTVDFLPVAHLPQILRDVTRRALSRKNRNTESSHEQILPLHTFIMIYDSIIHISTGITPAAAWPLGNTPVCTQHAALAGITDIRVVCPLQERVNAPSVEASSFPHGISAASSMWTLLGGKDREQSGLVLPFPGSLHFHTSWSGEIQFRVFHLYCHLGCCRWRNGDQQGKGQDRGKEKKENGGRELCWERDLRKMHHQYSSQTVLDWGWSRNSYTDLLPAVLYALVLQVDTCNMVFTCKRQSGLLPKLFQKQIL